MCSKKEKAVNAYKNAKLYIKKEPVKTILISTGVGFCIGVAIGCLLFNRCE